MVGFLIWRTILAEKKKVTKPKTKNNTKKSQTVRERSENTIAPKKRIRKTVKKVTKPVKSLKKLHQKEYHLPIPDSKLGKFLKRRVRVIPKFFVEAFGEVRLVTWPNRNDTIKLTLAVFIFAIFLASFVGILDYGLSKAFEEFIVNKN